MQVQFSAIMRYQRLWVSTEVEMWFEGGHLIRLIIHVGMVCPAGCNSCLTGAHRPDALVYGENHGQKTKVAAEEFMELACENMDELRDMTITVIPIEDGEYPRYLAICRE